MIGISISPKTIVIAVAGKTYFFHFFSCILGNFSRAPFLRLAIFAKAGLMYSITVIAANFGSHYLKRQTNSTIQFYFPLNSALTYKAPN